MAGEIILGFDGTEGAGAALDVAADLAKRLGVGVVIGFGYGVSPYGGENRDQEELLRGLGEGVAKRALERLEAAGVHAEIELVHDRPWEALKTVAASRDAVMIVVGSRGEGPIAGALLGSVAYKLVHQSRWPVLVVPNAV
jgi:nucleotide-binding universal stress UspA family protein